MSESIGSTARSKLSIVEEILEQGQRLRNAMVKSILDTDPLYIDKVENNNPFNNLHLHKGKRTEVFANSKKKIDDRNSDNLSSSDSFHIMSSELFDLYCNCEICNMNRNRNAWALRHLSTNSYNIKEYPVQSLDLIKPEKSHQFSGTTTNSYSRNKSDATISKDIEPKKIIDNSSKRQKEQTDSDVQTQTDSLSEAEEIVKSIQDNYRSRAAKYFKYVNSLKITIHSLSLNQAGTRKVSISSVDLKYKLPTSISHSYFVEYSVPDSLINSQPKTRSKVDSGLTANLFRICSKKLQNEEIYFKHTSIHDIVSLLQLNLQNIEIKFQVSCRTMKQKGANILGNATFNLSSFAVTKHLSCTQDFPIIDDGFALGTLKLSLQLGCGRMYFGKEFVEFVTNNAKNMEPTTETTIPSGRSENQPSVYESSEQASSVIFVDKSSTVDNKNINESRVKIANTKNNVINNNNKNHVEFPNENPSSSIASRQQSSGIGSMKRYVKQISVPEMHRSERIDSSVGTNRSDFQNDVRENTNYFTHSNRTASTEVDNKSLLYGLIYLSEAQYFEGTINSYLSCQVFCQGDTLCSRVVYNSKEPVFNFYQKVPFIFDNDFLICMRDSSIIVDFWERYDDEDIAIGTSQLSLHQFYIAYRNKVIADTLLQNRLPVTISDWWEPICSSVSGKIYGQMKVLVAVGTATQIHNLEVERGLKDNSLSVTYVPIVPEAHSLKKRILSGNSSTTDRSVYSFKRPDYLNKPMKEVKQNISKIVVDKNTKLKNKDTIGEVKKVDVGVQSDINMEAQDKSEAQSSSKTESMLEAFITQLLEQKQKNIHVENATNTETIDVHNNLSKNLNNERPGHSAAQSLNKLSQCKNATNAQLRKTSDLLDYLNDALSADKTVAPHTSTVPPLVDDENNFKAHVIVEGALHLPCRKKCKAKKTRRKNVSYEEALPSTYVTFETIPGADLKISPTIPRSSNPQWDFRCDVLLPGEILTNNQKRLIFKVWRRNNGNSPRPNLQTDVVLGFAALDLTVLLAGLPSVQGWFNIVDFSSKCNGQIKIHVTPLENILRFNESNLPSPEIVPADSPDRNFIRKQPLIRRLVEVREEPSELLNRALKRKFTELEEITQRLRSRLADVTKDDSDTSNDEFADEFERDINSLCVEDDYNMIDLVSLERRPQPHHELDLLSMEEDWSPEVVGLENNLLQEVGKSNLSQFASSDIPIFSKGTFQSESMSKFISSDSAYGSTHISDKAERPFVSTSYNFSSSNSASDLGLQINSPKRLLTPGDRQLIAGKERIDTLLEKLTLLSGAENAFPSRYVSGCSVNQESDKAGLNLDAILNPALFNQLCAFDANSLTSLTEPSEGFDSSSNALIENGSSSNSLLTQFSTYRQAPDGAGNSVDANKVYNNKQNI